MDSFDQKVAVVTGGASGIGLGLATALINEGAFVTIADVETGALDRARAVLASAGGAERVHAVVTDVAKYDSVEALRDSALDRFGRVDILVNNAGVCTFNPIPKVSIEDWHWVIDVDLWGVIHGVHAFYDVMVRQGTEGHIINTASLAGVIRGSRIINPYSVAKHGVVALSEGLRDEARHAGVPIGVTVLCPAHVASNAWDADRNRPGGREVRDAEGEAWRRGGGSNPTGLAVLSPAQFAEQVLGAVRRGEFWVFTDPPRRATVKDRFDEILDAYPNPAP